MLKVRVVTASILALGLVVVLFVLPPQWAVLACAAVLLLGAWEWAGFGSLRAVNLRLAYAAGIAVLLGASWQWTQSPSHLLVFLAAACVWWLLSLAWLTFAPARHSPASVLLCGVPVLVPTFVALARMQMAIHGFARGPSVVLWMLMLVFASDIGAYFAGRRWGRHKMAPRVSPGKTWEGAAGGLAAVAVLGFIGARHFGLPVAAGVVFCCIVGCFSMIGDLTESMFKRSAGLKDSGALLPGHGGILDRIDSVTAAAPLYALGLFAYGAIE